jgi:hypothetical protein
VRTAHARDTSSSSLEACGGDAFGLLTHDVHHVIHRDAAEGFPSADTTAVDKSRDSKGSDLVGAMSAESAPPPGPSACTGIRGPR